jgi:Rha family phage regulatory protein
MWQPTSAYFGKSHRSVLRAIRALLSAEPNLNRHSFAHIATVDSRGRSQPSYDMDRDGFTLLAMGFTGSKALRFKIAYVQAFNQMEAALRGSRDSGKASAPPERREFPDWPLEEMRAKKATVDLYRLVYGPLSAQWIMPQLGFPVPPKQLVRFGFQLSLLLDG